MSIASDLERHMLDLVNAERSALGFVSLVLDQTLNVSAEDHSRWMLDVNVFSHTGVDDSTATERMRAAGFDFSGAWRSGENLAVQSDRGSAGYLDDVADLHESLMNSPGHRANILNPDYRVIGIGIEVGNFTYSSGYNLFSVMATQNFAATQGRTTPDVLADPSSGESGENTSNDPQMMIEGGASDEILAGGSGNDTIDGGAGADRMAGGPGSDTYIVDDPDDQVAESRSWAGTDTVLSSVDFLMGRSHIENLTLTGNGDIRGVGNGLTNEIRGNSGDNILDGGKNNDTLIGGAGDDVYHTRAPGDLVIEAAGRGTDTVKAFRAYELTDNVERLFLQTLRNDAGEGIAGVNGIGNDLNNTIVGNPFDNIIVGREGRDTLKGQAGADTFVFDRAIGDDNVDRIIDLNVNEADEGDRLFMKGSVFGGLAAGALDAALFHLGTAAGDAGDRFIFDQTSGRLWFDADGTGGQSQQLIATFEQNAQVSAGDIEVF